MQTTLILDKQFEPELDNQLGKIGIRVVVFAKKQAGSTPTDDEVPQDLQPDEELDPSESEVNTYLEAPKRGKICCVFLINGQRHYGLDNSFIVNDLKMKYLRKRMIIVVDMDTLSPRAIGEIMTGSRSGIYKGRVFQKIRDRIVSTLHDDPQLAELEEEAEDELSQLQSGDAVVQQALDELIEHHFDLGDHSTGGADTAGGKKGQFFDPEGNPIDLGVVVFGENGMPVAGPVLVSNHASANIRLIPNTEKTVLVAVLPEGDSPRLKEIEVFVEPKDAGFAVTMNRNESGARLDIEFVEPENFDPEDYPIEATLTLMAEFNDVPELRSIAKSLIVRPHKPITPRPPRTLNDVPTSIKVASHQPVRLLAGGPDTHVRIVWDGKDSLTFDPAPDWTFHASCKSHPQFPAITFTKPANGRFEALIHTPADCLVGTRLDFELEAKGPGGAVLTTTFSGEVVQPAGPRKVIAEIPGRSQRRPPYKLVYVYEKSFGDSTRWGASTWTGGHAAAFAEPTATNPLTLCINQDFTLLRQCMDEMVSEKADEKRMEERKTKYTSHVAYHLYQMYLHKDEVRKKMAAPDHSDDLREPQDEEMQLEINRVASTLIRLMKVMR